MKHRIVWTVGLLLFGALAALGWDDKPAEPKRLDDAERAQYAAAQSAVNNIQGQLNQLGSEIINAPDGSEGALIAVGRAKVTACRSSLAESERKALYYRLCAIHGINKPDDFQIRADGVTFEPKK
jgi:hypothetical protein